MKILFIGGTGTISSAITRALQEQGHDLYLLNRGSRNGEFPKAPAGTPVKEIRGDINDETDIAEKRQAQGGGNQKQ
ncbi:hypothetical protein FACS189445_5220 [Spirochaetia bacterium]|nr:hypothetical protein FACS189445_5220 [Spirochaetia bacterium]